VRRKIGEHLGALAASSDTRLDDRLRGGIEVYQGLLERFEQMQTMLGGTK
jgi:hypothetical protein